jgi:small subunit ribosomal protein S6
MSGSYEMTIVVDSQIQEDGLAETVKRYEDLIASNDAKIFKVDRWGMRKLAYDINKQQQGNYTLFQFEADPKIIHDLDRACRLDEAVLRHLIISSPEGFEPEPEPEEPETDDDQDESEDSASVEDSESGGEDDEDGTQEEEDV